MSDIDKVMHIDSKNVLVSSISRNGIGTDAANIDPDESFLPLVEDAVAYCALSLSWHIEDKIQGSTRWLWAYNEASTIPEQGWKLHVSATMLSAGDVLKRVLPLLLAETTAFKIAATPRQIGVLNSGEGGISQVGKFITIYPKDDEQALRLAIALDEATTGLRGPAVPSDRPLRKGSLVHYRYGGFLHLGKQDVLGDVHMAIRAPSGELVPDERLSIYSPPKWVIDPFLEAGIAEVLAPASPLLAGRYLAVTTISESARGFVYKGIDVASMKRCILKHARRDGALGLDGMDAFDRLRNEARILSMLAPDPRFPQVIDMFELDGDLFLIMEEVTGENLHEHVRALSGQGRTLAIEQLLDWGRELAEMLGHIHERGLIYRDLKATNVIVAPEGQLRLVDFDISMEFPAERAHFSPGTIGYMSRQQSANEAPRMAHDIYSLGALLYFMATGADPSRFPHQFDILNRPPKWLNPGLPSSVEEIIGRCLDHDPEERFDSMQAVARALDAVRPGIEAAGEAPGMIAARVDYLEIARKLGDTLCMSAKHDAAGNGCYWINPRYSEIPVVARDLATGSAGPVLALSELVAELGEEKHREYLREGARWLASQPPPGVDPRPGLYNGEAGVSIALLRAGQVLRDDSLVEEAIRRGMWLATIPFTNPGVFNGTAGRVRFHLLLWDATGDEMHLDAAIKAGEELLYYDEGRGTKDEGPETIVRGPRVPSGRIPLIDRGVAEDDVEIGKYRHWAMPPGDGPHDGRTYTGYALGAAGIGDAMLDLFDVTGDVRFLEAAGGAARWLESLAQHALNDGSGVDWPPVEGEPLKGAFWGHGASGVGIFLLNALKHGLISRSDRLLERAALTAADGARWAGPTLAYGLGGPIEFLLDAHQETGNGTYLDCAEHLAAILETFAVEIDGCIFWPSEDAALYTPDYIVGYAGIAVLMLRLAYPRHIPRPVTMAASRRNRLQAVHRKFATGNHR